MTPGTSINTSPEFIAKLISDLLARSEITAGNVIAALTRDLAHEREARQEGERLLAVFAAEADKLGERDWGMHSVHIEALRDARAFLASASSKAGGNAKPSLGTPIAATTDLQFEPGVERPLSPETLAQLADIDAHTGFARPLPPASPSGQAAEIDRCIDCDGAGRYPNEMQCKSCGGTGAVARGDGEARAPGDVLMGAPPEASARLIDLTRQWRELRQPLTGTPAALKARDLQEREVAFRLCNAAMLWLWHQENASGTEEQAPIPSEAAVEARAARAAAEAYFGPELWERIEEVGSEPEIIRMTRALRAARAIDHPAGEVAQGWQPMESAPEDGTTIFAALLVINNQTGQEHWEHHIIWFDDVEGTIDDNAYQGWDWDDYSHWMPLPAPLSAAPQPPKSNPEGK